MKKSKAKKGFKRKVKIAPRPRNPTGAEVAEMRAAMGGQAAQLRELRKAFDAFLERYAEIRPAFIREEQ